MIRITDLLFYEHTMDTPEQYESWAPEDSAEFEEWIKVLVGLKDGEGHWFQVHVCTYASMSNIKEKIYLFPIPYWESVDSLIEKVLQCRICHGIGVGSMATINDIHN